MFPTKERDSGDQTVEETPEVDDLPVAVVQLDEGGGAGVGQHVVHVALVLAAVSPAEVIDDQTAVVEDVEVSLPAGVVPDGVGEDVLLQLVAVVPLVLSEGEELVARCEPEDCGRRTSLPG